MWMTLIKIAAVVLITTVIVAAFVNPPPLGSMPQGGAVSRLFFFHVPMAQVAFVSFVVAALYAIAYLRKRNNEHDRYAHTAAELGILFAIIALVTGSIWAKAAWGAYWNWDPRQLFLFVLILFYGAYFALRQSVVQADTRRRLSAVYLIFGGAISPLLFFVLPRMYQSLHGEANKVVTDAGSNMSPTVLTFFLMSTAGFLCLYVWLLKLGVTASRIEEEHLA
ncbi:MAG: cytochrome C biogenesis protein [candidate division Zixibacteria bacterium]|nr:cytochrome C biogenesis protein [candidate division Zixibacteria bacterium]